MPWWPPTVTATLRATVADIPAQELLPFWSALARMQVPVSLWCFRAARKVVAVTVQPVLQFAGVTLTLEARCHLADVVRPDPEGEPPPGHILMIRQSKLRRDPPTDRFTKHMIPEGERDLAHVDQVAHHRMVFVGPGVPAEFGPIAAKGDTHDWQTGWMETLTVGC